MSPRVGMTNEPPGLSEVVEKKGGHHERKPRESNRSASEVAHVRVESLASRDDEDDAAQNEEAVPSVVGEEPNGVCRMDRGEYGRVLYDLPCAEHGDRPEPKDHDWTEDPTDAGCAPLLHPEEGQQDDDGQWHDGRREPRCCHAEAFDGAEDRDRGCNHAVAIEQRRTEDHQAGDQSYPRGTSFLPRRDQRQEREDRSEE